MQELMESELDGIAGGCSHCEVNPPSWQDAYFAGPELYIETGLNHLDLEYMMS